MVELPTEARAENRRPIPLEYEGFFRDHYRKLIQVVLYMGATMPEAEDAVQDAMAAVLHRWEGTENPAAYARRVAERSFIKSRQRSLGRIRIRLIAKVPAAQQEGYHDAGITDLEATEQCMQMLMLLTPWERAAMALYFDGHTCVEIAEMSGKTEAAVRKALQRARERIQNAMRQEGRST